VTGQPGTEEYVIARQNQMSDKINEIGLIEIDPTFLWQKHDLLLVIDENGVQNPALRQGETREVALTSGEFDPNTGLLTWVLLSDGTKLVPGGEAAVWVPTSGPLEGQPILAIGYVIEAENVPEERWAGLGPACGRCQHAVYGRCYNYCAGSSRDCGCASCEDCTKRNQLICFAGRVHREEGYCSNYQCLYRTTTMVEDCCAYTIPATSDDPGDGNNPATTNWCYGGRAAGCQDAMCYTENMPNRLDHCTGTCHPESGEDGCYFVEYYPAVSLEGCLGNVMCGNWIYDADHHPNTCNTCRDQRDSTLRWNLGCSGGNDCAAFPNTCCGDDANEWSSVCSCNPDACSCSPGDSACCWHQNSCVWNNGCYVHSHSQDMDGDTMTEYCHHGTWHTYPRIESINSDISIVDRDKETETTRDVITFTADIYDQDNFDRSRVLITIANSLGNNEVFEEEMDCEDINSNNWRCTYAYNPRNDAPLGLYSISVKAIDSLGLSDTENYNNFFLVEDIAVRDITWEGWAGDNTTDFIFRGTVRTLSNNQPVSLLIDQRCSEPIIQNIDDGNYDTRLDADPDHLRLCGVNSFSDSRCYMTGGANFECYVQNLKLTSKNPTFSYILTNSDGISGSFDVNVTMECEIEDFGLDDEDRYVNPLQNITYSMNFTNSGDIGWWGEVYNQTHVSIWAPNEANPTGGEFVHVGYADRDSYINLESGANRKLSVTFNKNAHYVLGGYSSMLDLSYFWPELINSYGHLMHNFSLCGDSTGYTIAAIDITHHEIPKRALRGDFIKGEVGGYFVASMDIDYWEQVQGFRYRVTNETTTGEYWVVKRNLTSGEEEIEIPKSSMGWNGDLNIWEAQIDTFRLTTDHNDTIHRVYYIINWTEYNIYVPYVDGKWREEYYPYFWQEFNLTYVGRDVFEVTPSMVNVPLGIEGRDIISVSVLNAKNESAQIEIMLVARTNEDALNWLSFSGDVDDCIVGGFPLSGCISDKIDIGPRIDALSPAEGSTIIRLDTAARIGSYEFDVIVSAVTGAEIGRKRVQINIVSDAVGNKNTLGGVLLIVIALAVILYSERNRANIREIKQAKTKSKNRQKKK